MNPSILDICRVTIFVLLGMLSVSCTQQGGEGLLLPDPAEMKQHSIAAAFPANPSSQHLYPLSLPEDRRAVKAFPEALRIHIEENAVYQLRPEALFLKGKAGQSLQERNIGVLSGLPPQTDILFCFDLTGSMGEELLQAKLNALAIMERLRAVIPDSHFGLVSHMDYPGRMGGCGYEESYGSAVNGDYSFRLDQPFTGDLLKVADAIDALRLGGGRDFPENYARVFHEASRNPQVNWRPGAKRVMVAWLDAIPHDCRVDGIWGGNLSTGVDPGPDGLPGTSDDLSILSALEEMASQNITLLVLYSGVEENPYSSRSLFELWSDFAHLTGGRALKINPDGTVPGQQDMAAFLAEAVRREVGNIARLSLEVCTPDFGAWITEVSPRYYPFYNSPALKHLPFDLTVNIPENTPTGQYDFDVCLVGDGVVFASQTVHVSVD